MFYGTAMGQQPVYFQPQPMQQQQLNYQMAYVPQQQRPPQMHLVAGPTAPMQEKQAPATFTVPIEQQSKADATDVMVHPAK